MATQSPIVAEFTLVVDADGRSEQEVTAIILKSLDTMTAPFIAKAIMPWLNITNTRK
jgi:hypothetical protein